MTKGPSEASVHPTNLPSFTSYNPSCMSSYGTSSTLKIPSNDSSEIPCGMQFLVHQQ